MKFHSHMSVRWNAVRYLYVLLLVLLCDVDSDGGKFETAGRTPPTLPVARTYFGFKLLAFVFYLALPV
jgi:hypothetical protein